jgi:hypothetical protein
MPRPRYRPETSRANVIAAPFAFTERALAHASQGFLDHAQSTPVGVRLSEEKLTH